MRTFDSNRLNPDHENQTKRRQTRKERERQHAAQWHSHKTIAAAKHRSYFLSSPFWNQVRSNRSKKKMPGSEEPWTPVEWAINSVKVSQMK